MINFKQTIITCIAVIGLASWPQISTAHLDPSLSHGGGTDKCGCHTKKSTGEYHCHTRKKRGGSCPAFKKEVQAKKSVVES